MLTKNVIGVIRQISYLVENTHTISNRVNPQLPNVLGTFVLCEWMEISAGFLIQEYLSNGHFSLGRNINLSHYSPAYPGDTVTIEVIIKEINNSRVKFKIIAKCNDRVVAKAEHTRFFVNSNSFILNKSIEENAHEMV